MLWRLLVFTRQLILSRHLILASLLLVLVGAPAQAQPADAAASANNPKKLARQRFREATEAFNEGRYAAAASLFEAADRLSPRAAARYNAATAWEDAGEAPRAATGYEAALAQGTLDTSQETIARERLNALKSSLAHVRILRPLGAFVTVDHVQRIPVPTSFYLRPGAYDIVTEYRGTRTTTHSTVEAGKGHIIEPEVPFEATTPAPEAATKPLPEPPSSPTPKDEASSQKTWGWIGVGAGVVLSGAAVIMGVNALAARDDYRGSGNTDPGARDRAASRRLTTNLLWGGAAVSGATGIVLLLTLPKVEF